MLKNYIYFYLLIFQIFRCESIVVPTRFVELRQVPRFGPRGGGFDYEGFRKPEIGPRSWLTFVRNKFGLRVFLTCGQFGWSDDGSADKNSQVHLHCFYDELTDVFHAKYSWWSRKPFSWKVSRWVLDILNGFTFKKYFCRFFLASLQNSRSRSTACADGLDVDFFFLRPLSLWTYESSP